MGNREIGLNKDLFLLVDFHFCCLVVSRLPSSDKVSHGGGGLVEVEWMFIKIKG